MRTNQPRLTTDPSPNGAWAFPRMGRLQHRLNHSPSAGGSRGRPGRYLTADGVRPRPRGFKLTRGGAFNRVLAGLGLCRRQLARHVQGVRSTGRCWVPRPPDRRLAPHVRTTRVARRKSGARLRQSSTELLLGRVSAVGPGSSRSSCCSGSRTSIRSCRLEKGPFELASPLGKAGQQLRVQDVPGPDARRPHRLGPLGTPRQ